MLTPQHAHSPSSSRMDYAVAVQLWSDADVYAGVDVDGI